MLLAGGLGQQGMGSAAGAVAGYGGRLCGQGAAEYAAGGARAAVINDREPRSECGEQESGYCKIRRVWLFVGWRSFIAGSRSVGVVVGSSSTHVRTAHARSEARRRVGPYRSWARAPKQQQSYRPRHALLLATHAWDEACRRAVRAHRRAARAYRPARKCISAASSAREQQQHGGGEAGRPRNLETRALVTWCAHTLVGCRTADGDRRQRLYIRESSAD